MPQPRPQTEEEQADFLRYFQPNRWPILARYPVSDTLLNQLMAEVIGCSAEKVRNMSDAFERCNTQNATHLMREPAYRAGIDDLPFDAGDIVLALGDSNTADRLGWFELLAASLRAAGRIDISTHNLAVSGNTTAAAIEQWDLVAGIRPTHILVMLGTNDAREHGTHARHRMVTPAETIRNLTALRALVTEELHAEVRFITPPPSDATRARSSMPDFPPVVWRPHDIDEMAEIVRRLSDDHVDLHSALVDDVRSGRLVENDGVHLNVDGQRAAARLIVSQLRRHRCRGS